MENAADTLILADLHSAEHLKEMCINFINRYEVREELSWWIRAGEGLWFYSFQEIT